MELNCRDAIIWEENKRRLLFLPSWSGLSSGPSPAALSSLVGESLALLGGLEDLEGAHEGLVDGHHGAGVVELSAVIWGGEKGDELPAGEELVSVLDDLVGAADEVEVVLVKELGDDVLAEGEGDAAIVLAPPVDVLVGVGPEQVAEEAGVGNVGRADDALDLIEAGELGGEASVGAEDLLVDDGRAGEAVEAVGEGLPELDAEAALALVVEAVDAVDGGALVVAAEDEEVLGILDLIRQQETYCFQGLLAAVDVVAEEDVVGLRRESAVFEKAEEVVVLPVNVTADLDRGLELQEHGLADQEVAAAEAQHLDLGLRQVDLLPGSGSPDAAIGKPHKKSEEVRQGINISENIVQLSSLGKQNHHIETFSVGRIFKTGHGRMAPDTRRSPPLGPRPPNRPAPTPSSNPVHMARDSSSGALLPGARTIPEEYVPLAAEGSFVRPGDKINSPQQLVDDHVDGIAEEGDPSLSGSVASGRVGTAGGRVSVGTVHACLLLRKQNR